VGRLAVGRLELDRLVEAGLFGSDWLDVCPFDVGLPEADRLVGFGRLEAGRLDVGRPEVDRLDVIRLDVGRAAAAAGRFFAPLAALSPLARCAPRVPWDGAVTRARPLPAPALPERAGAVRRVPGVEPARRPGCADFVPAEEDD
jgi:hypothetical protein